MRNIFVPNFNYIYSENFSPFMSLEKPEVLRAHDKYPRNYQEQDLLQWLLLAISRGYLMISGSTF